MAELTGNCRGQDAADAVSNGRRTAHLPTTRGEIGCNPSSAQAFKGLESVKL